MLNLFLDGLSLPRMTGSVFSFLGRKLFGHTGEFDLVVVGVQECSYDWVSEWVTTPKRNPKRRKSLKGSGKTALPMLSGALEEGLHALENIAFGSPPESPERRKKVVRDVGEEAFSFHWDDILAERLGDGFTRVQQARESWSGLADLGLSHGTWLLHAFAIFTEVIQLHSARPC